MTVARLLLLAILLATHEAYACSCAGPIGPDLAYEKASVVFEGKVVAVEDQYTMLRKALDKLDERVGRKPNWDEWERTHGVKITFEVIKVWKGSLTKKRFVLYTGRGAGDCGFPFEKGEVHLVYAYCRSTHCSTSVCTRTGLRSHASSDLRYLATVKK